MLLDVVAGVGRGPMHVLRRVGYSNLAGHNRTMSPTRGETKESGNEQ